VRQSTLTVTSFTIVDGNGNTVSTTLTADARTTGYANWAFATPNAALAVRSSRRS